MAKHTFRVSCECGTRYDPPRCMQDVTKQADDVPWYMCILPILNVHVKHGVCPLRCDIGGIKIYSTTDSAV